MALVGTYDGTVRVIDGLVQAGCCCDDCCADPGGPPTADFSYEQISDDPCTINLTDESVAGTCGEIVEWQWLLNGVAFSTSQNPSGVEVADEDDVTLEVTDASGCTDSVVMQINCVDLLECGCCSDDIPSSVTVTMSGWSDDTCPNGDCTNLNGTFTIPYDSTTNPGARCRFYLALPYDKCNFTGFMFIEVTLCESTGSGDRIYVEVVTSDFTSYIYLLPSPGPCRGTHTLPFTLGGGTDCNYPSSITLTV